MPTDLQCFRDLLVDHANRLPRKEARAWLLGHRLISLSRHPDLEPELRSHLDAQRKPILASNILKIKIFQDVAGALGSIPMAPLKGIALLDSLYREDISLRPMSDIDLLVPQEDIDKAVRRLAAIGIRESEPSHRLRRVMHHRHLKGLQTTVELHTRLGTAFLPSSGWKAVSPVPAAVHGVDARRLTPAVELVHLLVHFYKHRPFTCLGWVDEILALGQQASSQIQDEMVQAAHRLRCRTPLAVAIDLLRRALPPDRGIPSRSASEDEAVTAHGRVAQFYC